MSSSAPRPRFGQHFLTDRNLLRRIADALDPGPDDVVIEVGAGRGDLTRVIAPRVRRVVAIERDRGLADECGRRNAECGIANVEIVGGNALTVDWHAAAGLLPTPHSAFRIPHFKVLGNIPYAITSPLIEKALGTPLPERIVFLVQREVADRLSARPGSRAYGALTVGVQAVSRVERLFPVRAGAFRPPPRVQSAVVRLTPLAAPLVGPDEPPALRAFVAACFAGRRKQLRNAVARAARVPAAATAAGLAALGLDPAARPETLAPADFIRLLRWSRSL